MFLCMFLKLIKPTEFQLVLFLLVIPWGLEPQSKEPESFILSIELRNRKLGGLFDFPGTNLIIFFRFEKDVVNKKGDIRPLYFYSS